MANESWEPPQQEGQTEWRTPDRFSTVEMQQDAAAFRAIIAARVNQSKLQVIQHINQLHSEWLMAAASAPDQQLESLLRLNSHLDQFDHVVDSQ